MGADFSYSFEDVFDPEVNCDYLSELLEVWDDFALITNGDAVFSGNAIDKGIVIGGTFSRTGSHNIQVNQQSKAPSNYAGTFDADNVNYKRGTSSIFPNWYDWETFQKVAESVTDSENLYVVQNDEAADYDLYDFGDSNAQSNNNGKTLVVFLGTGDITLVKASGRDFGPSILAPFAKVIAGGSLGEVNGFIVADSFEHLGSSGFSISGKGYKNEIACAPTTSPTSAPTPFYVFNVDPATTTSENICLNYPECYQMEMTTRVGSSSLTSRISTALTTIETTADEEFVSTSFCLDDSGEIELAPTHAPTLQPTESQMPTPMPSTAVPSPAPTQATSVNVVSGTMCLGGGCGGSTSTEDLRRRRRLEEEEPDAEDYQEALLAVCVDEALAVVFSNVTEDAFANETGFFAPGTELSQIDAVCTINVTLPDETPILSFTCEIETLRDETHKIDGRRIASAEIEAGLTDAFEKVAVGNDEFSDLIIAAIRSNEDESCTNNLLISTTPTNSIEVLELIEEAEVEAIEVAVETANPTSVPTSAPSEVPSPAPTYVPTPVPTTEMPTPETPYPTEMPTTYAPSILPTSIPTMLPTYDPTRMPTSAAPTPETPYPTVSKAPSGLPTPAPTILPTYLPTYAPTHYSPTNPPNIQPSYSPTESPTNVECNEDEDCPGDYVCEISGSRRRRRRRKMLLGYSIGICVLPED